MNERAVEKESRVERRKGVVFHANVMPQMLFQQRGIRQEHGRKAASPNAFRERTNGRKPVGKLPVYKHQTSARQVGEGQLAKSFGSNAVSACVDNRLVGELR